MKKKHIVIILPNLKNGGAERVHVYLANEWVKIGYKVTFILMKNIGELNTVLNKKINIIETNTEKIRNFIIPLSKSFNKIKPDVAISAMWPLTSISIISKLISKHKFKIILVEHCKISGQYLKDINSNYFFVKMIMKLTYYFSDNIICVSKCVKKDIQNFIKNKKKFIKVIYNPISFKNNYKFNKKKYIKYYGNAKYKLLSIGTLKKQKNLKNLILAFNYLNKKLDAKLVIVGDGPEKNSLLKLIQDLKLTNKVLLVGNYKDTYPWYSISDLFIHSADYDGMPLTLIESLSCGTPILSTDSQCGPSEILSNGKYGKLVKINDYKSLASGIKFMLNKSHKKQKLIDRSKFFSINKISNQYIEYF
tara:strand:+ start:92 stop:1180 length:1089 start_codon:yes stop_codon:yes gene_type:complete